MTTGNDIPVTAMTTGNDIPVTAMTTGNDINVTAMTTGNDIISVRNLIFGQHRPIIISRRPHCRFQRKLSKFHHRPA